MNRANLCYGRSALVGHSEDMSNEAAAAKPGPADADTHAAMLAIAKQVASEHAATVTRGSKSCEIQADVIDYVSRRGQDVLAREIWVTVSQNWVVRKDEAHSMLVTVRRAILDAWAAAGFAAGERTQRSCKPGQRTWLWTGGLFHMGHQSTDWRRWRGVCRERPAAA